MEQEKDCECGDCEATWDYDELEGCMICPDCGGRVTSSERERIDQQRTEREKVAETQPTQRRKRPSQSANDLYRDASLHYESKDYEKVIANCSVLLPGYPESQEAKWTITNFNLLKLIKKYREQVLQTNNYTADKQHSDNLLKELDRLHDIASFVKSDKGRAGIMVIVVIASVIATIIIDYFLKISNPFVGLIIWFVLVGSAEMLYTRPHREKMQQLRDNLPTLGDFKILRDESNLQSIES